MASEGRLPGERGQPGLGQGGWVSLPETPERRRLREIERDLLYFCEVSWVVFTHNPEKACCFFGFFLNYIPVWFGVFCCFFFKHKSYVHVCIYVTYKENTCDFNLQLIYTVCTTHLELANHLGA